MSRIAHSRNKHSIGIPNGSVSSSKTTSHFFQSELQWKNKSIIKLASTYSTNKDVIDEFSDFINKNLHINLNAMNKRSMFTPSHNSTTPMTNKNKKVIKLRMFSQLDNYPKVKISNIVVNNNSTFITAYASNSYEGGYRNYNEDRISINEFHSNVISNNTIYYFALFDGHGGNACCDFLNNNLFNFITTNHYFPSEPIKALQDSFSKAEEYFVTSNMPQNLYQTFEKSGSCGIVVLIIKNIVYCANVGDSRGVYSENNSKIVFQMNNEHKPLNEKKRIEDAGGEIYQTNPINLTGTRTKNTLPWRIIPGNLSVSRAFGDLEAKLKDLGGNPNVLIATPEITTFTLSEKSDFIILGCDGIFDSLDNKEIIKTVWEYKNILKGKLDTKDHGSLIGDICDNIIKKSIKNGSTDNVSCIVISFSNFYKAMNDQMINPLDYINRVNCNKILSSITDTNMINSFLHRSFMMKKPKKINLLDQGRYIRPKKVFIKEKIISMNSSNNTNSVIIDSKDKIKKHFGLNKVIGITTKHPSNNSYSFLPPLIYEKK